MVPVDGETKAAKIITNLTERHPFKVVKYSTVIKKTSPGAILGSIFSKPVENFEKH